MVYYELGAPQVHGSGQQVTGLATGATGLAQRYGTALGTAESTVGHPVVAAALRRFTQQWHPPASRVAGRVEELGVSTSGSAVTIADCDLTAEHTLLGTGADPVHLHRPINRPPVCPGI